jgi:hypothetical protein
MAGAGGTRWHEGNRRQQVNVLPREESRLRIAIAAGKAGQTLARRVIPTIPPPPPTTASQLDIALAAISAGSELLRSRVDTVDTNWATKQQAAIPESPPNGYTSTRQTPWRCARGAGMWGFLGL